MAITPGDDIETKTGEPLPRGNWLDRTGNITRAVMNYFNGKDRLAGEIVSGVNRNRQNIVQLETDYQAADGAVSSAYIAADAVVASDASGARATLETTLRAEYQAADSAIEGDVATNAAAITTEATARASADSALASDISDLTATVDDNTAAISTEATARADGDSAEATARQTLEAYVSNVNANLLPNGGFELGEDDWTLTSSAIGNDTNGTYLTGTSVAGGTVVAAYSPWFPAGASRAYSVGLDYLHTLATGTFRVDIEWYNGASFLSRSGVLTMLTGSAYARATLENQTSPANTTRGRLRFYYVSSTTNDRYRIRKVKVEQASEATNYTAEGSSVYAGASVSVLKQAFIDSAGDAIAQFVVEASAGGGDPARIGLRDGSGGSSIALVAEQIFFGSDTVFEDTYNTLYTEDGGGYRLRILGPFPASGDLVIWYGADSVALNSETKTNGVFCLATDGKVYFGSNDLSNEVGGMSLAMTGGFYSGASGSGKTTGNLNCTATNTTGTVSYLWTCSDPAVSFTAPTSATTQAQRDITSTVTAVARCLVTDSSGSKEGSAQIRWTVI
jgi:hypothetical protein